MKAIVDRTRVLAEGLATIRTQFQLPGDFPTDAPVRATVAVAGERLGQVKAPTLVIHGTEDRFFPIGNGRALANEIPGARLLPIQGMGHELPRAAWDPIVAAILRHTS